jgi:hypothetical protein
MITNNFAHREVSTAAYDKQQTHLRPIAVDLDHGILPMNFNEKKIDKKIHLIYSTSISWIACNTVSKLQLPWPTWPWWGIFYQI